MPKNTATPSAWRISAPAPLAKASGTTPKMKAKEVIRIGRSRVRPASEAASCRSRPVLQLALAGELDDQDGVLRRQADQHDEADLGEDVVVHAAQVHAGHGGQDAHRHDQDHRERQGDALVERGQQQEDEHHRQREHQHAGVAGQLLLVGKLGPLEAVARRQAPW